MLGDLKSARWIHFKGWLFLLMGIVAAVLLIIEAPSWKVAALLAICIWAFCRFYYYAFYVIEKYVDPSFKFAGLGAFVRWWLTRKK
jgi:hypothetical protein